MAGYTYLDPRTTQSNRPAEVGRQTAQTARQTASLWLDYRPHQIQGLMLGGGLRYRGKAPLNTAADGTTPYNPAFTLADVVVAYETPRYRVALNINNVFDKRYWASAAGVSGGSLNMGSPRSAPPAWRRTRDSGATQAPTPAAASSSARRKDPACAAGALAAAP
ncbi:hypothetical protein G6F31_015101 [Rhizopus arrhizus]|nr:hypothetical protein G6F31_015101 [Rhizopus arrhizus]